MKTLGMVLAAVAGCGMCGALYQRVWKTKQDIAALYIEGFLGIFSLAGVVSLPFIKLRMSFGAYYVILAVCTGVIILTGSFFVIKRLQGRQTLETQSEQKIREWSRHLISLENVPYALAGLVFAALVAGLFLYEPAIGSDMTAESIFTTVQTDSLFEYNPATGRRLEIGIYPTSKLMILPLFYGVLYQAGSLDMQLFLYRLIPFLLLILNYLIIWKWSVFFFPQGQVQNREKRGMFLFFYGLLVWFGDYCEGTYSYRLLHEGWKGESILGGIVLPWLAWICMDILQQGMERRKLCSVALCLLAGVFLVPWKTAAVLEIMTIAFFVLIWMIRRGLQCLKQRR